MRKGLILKLQCKVKQTKESVISTGIIILAIFTGCKISSAINEYQYY